MSRTLRILIADDDSEMRAWLSVALKPIHYVVEELDSGLGLLERIASDAPFDAVVTDVRMPGPDGLRVVAMARTAGLAVPFLVITAFPDPEVIRLVHGIPGTTLLAKPFEVGELRTAIAELIARKRATTPCDSSPSSSSP